MYKDIFEELAFKFGSLPDLKPKHIKTKLDFLNFAIKDEFVHNFNPSRYTFYMEFLKGLNNPDLLRNIIYENKLIKNNNEEINKIVEEIVNKMNLLYSISSVTTNKNILKDDVTYLKLKNALRDKENEELSKRIISILNTYDIKDNTDPTNTKVNKEVNRLFEIEKDNEEKKLKIAEERAKKAEEEAKQAKKAKIDAEEIAKQAIIAQQIAENQAIMDKGQGQGNENQYPIGYVREGGAPSEEENPKSDNEDDEPLSAMDEIKKRTTKNANAARHAETENEEELEKMKENLKKIKEKFHNNSLLHNYRDKLKFVLDTPSIDSKIKASKLRDILIEIEQDELTSINNIKVSKEDKLVFIGITFLIRLLTLVMIDWALNTNFCVNFTQCYILYLVLYSVFLLIIIVIINITYNYPIFKLYEGNHSFYTSLVSAFYYFYLIPGYTFKSGIKLILHFAIIIFLTVIAILIVDNKSDTVTLNYDYREKKNIRKSLNNFTLILWLFTSIIAMNVS